MVTGNILRESLPRHVYTHEGDLKSDFIVALLSRSAF